MKNQIHNVVYKKLFIIITTLPCWKKHFMCKINDLILKTILCSINVSYMYYIVKECFGSSLGVMYSNTESLPLNFEITRSLKWKIVALFGSF